MTANFELNLIGVVSPFCLLEFKAALSRLRPGQILEILIRDPEVMRDLVRLVDHSPDRLLGSEKIGKTFRLVVKRVGTTNAEVEEEI
jgi:TusA-related sulfurtransferase